MGKLSIEGKIKIAGRRALGRQDAAARTHAQTHRGAVWEYRQVTWTDGPIISPECNVGKFHHTAGRVG